MVNRLIGAALLIGIGFMVFLHIWGGGDFSLGYLFSTFWPVIFLYLGLSNIKERNYIGGFILLILGAHFLGNNFGYYFFSIGDLFRYAVPIALIGGGLYVLLSPRRRDRKHNKTKKEEYYVPPVPPKEPEPPYSDFDRQFEQKFGTTFHNETKQEFQGYGNEYDNKTQGKVNFGSSKEHNKYGNSYHSDETSFHQGKINKSAFIGDIRLGDDYYELKPMNLSQFIGDTVIDLTKAQIPYGETRIHISSFIGDIKVFAPKDMDVGIMVTSNSFIGDMNVLSNTKSGFMGNAIAETPGYRDAGKKVRIVISVFIGDVKVNSIG
ncbi:cell wall-active antibiotics response protein LiaF [Paenibacillus sp. Marseille-Q4541]|uniref:cell wall-active antibiotics response protein LiaF n=1 Tax=Paenibacillus sp. Marseille-Q4541 TaxID=2831522 RepID=UPI001BA6ADE8|nr:cell wall-active antibiotics response protein LiaF [Paenibacillus sp. Marseille-Q4541]